MGGYRWQHFGVPVKEVVANPTFYGAYLRKYDETINAANSYYQKWVNLTNESKLEKFRGYEITQDAQDAPAMTSNPGRIGVLRPNHYVNASGSNCKRFHRYKRV